MTLNKSACRKVADIPLQINSNNGLLHAEPVKWLIRTAVRLIDHHRLLVLYIYSREAALHGNLAPKWTVFHSKDNYITLERKEDGSAKWRTSSFERLSADWILSEHCAFITFSDEQRILRFFADSGENGIRALKRRQHIIMDKRQAKRQETIRRKIAARMDTVPAVPRGLKNWVQRQVMPAYFIIDRQDSRKAIPGVCTACGKVAELTGAKHNGKVVCPHCKRELTVKSRGRVKYLSDRDTVQVVQHTAPNEVVVRIFKVELDHFKPQLEIYEAARQFISLKMGGKLGYEEYYCDFGTWKRGTRPVFSRYQYSFWADTCAHTYCGNLPDALHGTPWQYCPIKPFHEHYHERMQLSPFLTAHIRHPKLEHLCKVGFYELAADLIYKSPDANLDESQNRTHRILGVAAEDVAFLRDLQVNAETLKTFTRYSGLKDRQALMRWQLQHKVNRDIPEILQHTTPHKLMRYAEKQQSIRRRAMQDIVAEYRDYLDMVQKLNYDLKNDFVLLPKDLKQAHDRAAKQVKVKADALMRKNFALAYESIAHKLDYEQSGMKILCPGSPEDLAREGQALHHCVGGYVDRVARKECIIVFLRRADDPATPFYTVEVREHKAVQVRGNHNADPTPEVQEFMRLWERKVLCAAA